jgi:murein DD-endopeptidase MepM/ murein hydrolase activator NlpD
MRDWNCALACALACLPLLTGCRSDPVPLPPPPRSDIVLESQSETYAGRVPVDATLASLLASHGIAPDMVPRIVSAAATCFDPRRLRQGQPYQVVLTLQGLFRQFEYEIDADRILRVATARDSAPLELQTEIVPLPKERIVTALQGSIDAGASSLIAAMSRAGEGLDLALALANIFSGQVDFNSDLRKGDSFQLLFEKDLREGRPPGYGGILAAELVNDGHRLQAFRFVSDDGQPRYFDESGRSVRRLLLPSPLPFDPRVTSRFSSRRMHPILGIARAHYGVDYAAPTGTPVLAVADGTVVSVTSGGESGRMVQLRHASGYHSYYLHLSAFAPGLRAGARVSQGQLIGRVGSSGLASGPHLDYRLSRSGRFVDPIAERRNMPAGEPVPATLMPAFSGARDEARRRLEERLAAATPAGELTRATAPASPQP